MDFHNIESLKQYLLRLDSHFHRTNQPSQPSNKQNESPYTYSSSFIRKVSLKASLKVKNASHRLFSRQAIEVAHERKVTHIQKAKLEKMTPSVLKEASLDHGKVTPLEVAHVDVHEDALKLDAEHMALLKPKRLSRVRHSRCKA